MSDVGSARWRVHSVLANLALSQAIEMPLFLLAGWGAGFITANLVLMAVVFALIYGFEPLGVREKIQARLSQQPWVSVELA